MLRRTHLSQALVFCLVLGTFATLYPIRNATEQLNNQEASAYGSSHVKYVSLGDSHSCAVTSAGGVKCWGLNTSGQVGNSGAGSYPSTPVDVTGLTSGVSSVALGDTHSCVVTSGGGVKCWGSNSSGQLGDGTTTRQDTPVSVLASANVDLTGIVAVSAGSAHSCALTTTGGVKCWGGNTSGQLGNDSVTNSSTPVDVTGLTSGVTAISVGGSYSCALMSNGTVKCWGDAAYGQLGNGNFNPQKTPVSVLASEGVGLSGVSAISTGTWHACA
ncbi:MAG: RCC1 domain-containing protein, partial [Ilumatobacteraceae bacterium]